ncbi:DUF302 domain-containing protein [Nocardioides panaciterrulae]|uniref:Uncharacterized protein (DUF302 family) n=1 Tax=Nocardioides panaciterrulae TaxID=661492 RepID=A0A7Y9EA25_9ACTN|nr:DUF302 domain-containing protein [Nocardioides panaciterrulae]NYD43874.1 uncharacterized protein (DUF302 family) [Nocardioides panaciterrulae]
MGYTLATTVARPFDRTLAEVRDALAEQGFGVLTEIDLRATLKAKLDVDVAPHVILGACRPQLAHQALGIDPAVATMLPCNVAVRAVDETTTTVEAFDPDAMTQLAGEALGEVAADARRRLTAVLAGLDAADPDADPAADTDEEH